MILTVKGIRVSYIVDKRLNSIEQKKGSQIMSMILQLHKYLLSTRGHKNLNESLETNQVFSGLHKLRSGKVFRVNCLHRSLILVYISSTFRTYFGHLITLEIVERHKNPTNFIDYPISRCCQKEVK